VDEGHLVRVWTHPVGRGEDKILGLYSADNESQLSGLLGALPLYEWMQIVVTPLEPHPNDPVGAGTTIPDRPGPGLSAPLPDPRLTKVYRLEATLAPPLDLGDVAQGHRRIVPLTGGTFTGPEIRGKLLAGASAAGRSSCRTGPHLATSATRCRPTPALCSTSSRGVYDTAVLRSSHVSRAARTSTQASTRSAPQRRSKLQPQTSTG
jgi:muconolactone delta-isomerase